MIRPARPLDKPLSSPTDIEIVAFLSLQLDEHARAGQVRRRDVRTEGIVLAACQKFGFVFKDDIRALLRDERTRFLEVAKFGTVELGFDQKGEPVWPT